MYNNLKAKIKNYKNHLGRNQERSFVYNYQVSNYSGCTNIPSQYWMNKIDRREKKKKSHRQSQRAVNQDAVCNESSS